MGTTIDMLSEISDRCVAHAGLSREQEDWLGEILRGILERRYASIEDMLGGRQGRGGVPWWLELAIRRRNSAICEIARRHLAAESQSRQASTIYSMAVRYAASAWRIDKDRNSMPESYAGTPREWLWLAFRSGARMPVGERQLRLILPSAG